MSDGIKRMLAERAALATRPPAIDETDRLFEKQQTSKIRHFFNEGWDGSGWSPFHTLEIGYCILMTKEKRPGVFVAFKQRETHATLFWRIMLREARERYRAGYCADPFTNEPKWRADAHPWSWPAL